MRLNRDLKILQLPSNKMLTTIATLKKINYKRLWLTLMSLLTLKPNLSQSLLSLRSQRATKPLFRTSWTAQSASFS